MTASNKILTVSYGTFSCTLEGFDNPFGTMQSIAEYFRDLAAEDRYFGAEPPTPDAQMLHQIAEKEVRRRVDARVEDNGVVLRQMPDGAGTALATAPGTEDAPAPAAAPEAQTDIEEAPAAESVTEKLSRIRAVVAKARAERERTYAEDEPVEDGDDESLLSAFAAAEDAELAEAEPDYETDAEVDDESEPGLTAADSMRDESDESDDADETLGADGEIDVAADEETDAEADAERFTAVDDEATRAEIIHEIAEQDAPSAPFTPAALSLASEDDSVAMATGMDLPPADRAETAQEVPSTADVEIADETGEASSAIEDGEAVAPLSDESGVIAGLEPLAAADTAGDTDPDDVEPEQDAVDVADDETVEGLDESAADDLTLRALIQETSDKTIEPDVETADAEVQSDADLPLETEGTVAEAEVAAAPDADVIAEPDDTDLDEPEIAVADAAEADIEDAQFEDAETDADDELMRGISVALDERADSQRDAVPDTEVEAAAEQDTIEVEMEDEDGTPRLVTMSREEFEAALSSGEIEEIDEDEASDGDAVADEQTDLENMQEIRKFLDGTSLDEQDLDDLAAELAAIEADTQDDPITTPEALDAAHSEDPESVEEQEPEESSSEPDPVVAHDASETQDTDKTPAPRASGSDGDLDRLIEEANAQLDQPEGNRRRNAIAHLKRAVAATKADTGLRGEASDGESTLSKFRDDLNQVVRPRRPDSDREGARSRRPDMLLTGRPAPLVLVSSQRIDGSDGPVSPVRPRRIATEDAPPSATDDRPDESVSTGSDDTQSAGAQSFSDFAAKRGATELPDLLEAAAAYAQIVEGRESVSRPQMLRRASQATGEVSREDGLKSFGMLLRTGRIRKLSSGRFSVAEERKTG